MKFLKNTKTESKILTCRKLRLKKLLNNVTVNSTFFSADKPQKIRNQKPP